MWTIFCKLYSLVYVIGLMDGGTKNSCIICISNIDVRVFLTLPGCSLIGLSKERPILDHHPKAHIHLKSTQNLIKSDVSTKTLQFGGCMEGAMTPDFMKSRVIAPLLHSSNWIVLVETSAFTRFWVDFTWNPPDFMQISWNPADFNRKTHLQGIVTLCFRNICMNVTVWLTMYEIVLTNRKTKSLVGKSNYKTQEITDYG